MRTEVIPMLILCFAMAITNGFLREFDRAHAYLAACFVIAAIAVREKK